MSQNALINAESASAIADELAILFADAPKVSAEDFQTLHEAAAALEHDPKFQADCLKGHFVSRILGAMHVLEVSKSQLAQHWGRTRQYLGKILNESNRVNFTIDTMVELAMLLNRRIKIDVVEIEETVSFIHSQIPEGLKPGFASPFEIRPPSNLTQTFRNDYRTQGNDCNTGADAQGLADRRTALSA